MVHKDGGVEEQAAEEGHLEGVHLHWGLLFIIQQRLQRRRRPALRAKEPEGQVAEAELGEKHGEEVKRLRLSSKIVVGRVALMV